MVTYCRQCGLGLGYPFSSIRTSRGPCDICGGYDPGLKTNYTYSSRLLPGTRDDENKKADLEYDGAKI